MTSLINHDVITCNESGPMAACDWEWVGLNCNLDVQPYVVTLLHDGPCGDMHG